MRRADVYQLSPLTGLPLDELLPVVDAVELLGLVTVDAGDLTLTPLGKTVCRSGYPGTQSHLRHPNPPGAPDQLDRADVNVGGSDTGSIRM